MFQAEIAKCKSAKSHENTHSMLQEMPGYSIALYTNFWTTSVNKFISFLDIPQRLTNNIFSKGKITCSLTCNNMALYLVPP